MTLCKDAGLYWRKVIIRRSRFIFLIIISINNSSTDRLCGLVVRVPGYRSRGPGSVPSATRFSD
jgi:hypothetical protein